METVGNEAVSSTVSFKKQINGYDMAQVNAYIKNITEAYQIAYDEFSIKCEEYDQLLENFTMLQTREQSRPSTDVISSTLLNAEMFSKKIMADARIEAEKIQKEAYMEKVAAKKQGKRLRDEAVADAAQIRREVQAVLENATAEAMLLKEDAQVIIDNACAEAAVLKEDALVIIDNAHAEAAVLKEDAQVVIDNARAEAAVIKENAQVMINDARSEAARIKFYSGKKVRQANEKTTRTAGQMQRLTLPRVLDYQNERKPGVVHQTPHAK